jgi:hypothetical protein
MRIVFEFGWRAYDIRDNTDWSGIRVYWDSNKGLDRKIWWGWYASPWNIFVRRCRWLHWPWHRNVETVDGWEGPLRTCTKCGRTWNREWKSKFNSRRER